jgi:hypothetical protein
VIALSGIDSTVIRSMSVLAVISESFVPAIRRPPSVKSCKTSACLGIEKIVISLYIYCSNLFAFSVALFRYFDSAFFAHAAPNKERHTKKHKPLDSKVNLKFA